jgi:plasmid stabilization system protein ParE
VTETVLDAEAEAEVVAAGDWYHLHARAGVALRFLEAVERAMSEVAESPEAHPVVEEWKGVVLRRAIVRGFPFAIVYGRVGEVLRVFAVAHMHRQPAYWRHRLPPPAT